MATKLNTTEIKSNEPASADGSWRRIRLEDGADLTMHKDILEPNTHGTSFSFSGLKFETEADRRRKERGMSATVAVE